MAAASFGCNKVAILGDFFNAGHYSRHGKESGGSFESENATLARFTDNCKTLGMVPTFFIEGNHEGWWEEYARENPGISHQNAYPALYADWDYLPQGSMVEIHPHLTACHGDALNGSTSASPAASVLRHYPAANLIFGHNHRLDMAIQSRWTAKGTKMYTAVSVGTLVSADYEQKRKALRLSGQRHNLGFGVVTYIDHDLFDIQLGRIFNQRGLVCMLGGAAYRLNKPTKKTTKK